MSYFSVIHSWSNPLFLRPYGISFEAKSRSLKTLWPGKHKDPWVKSVWSNNCCTHQTFHIHLPPEQNNLDFFNHFRSQLDFELDQWGAMRKKKRCLDSFSENQNWKKEICDFFIFEFKSAKKVCCTKKGWEPLHVTHQTASFETAPVC